MPRIPVTMTIADVSAFARALARALPRDGAVPSHLALLNMVARAAGHSNWQALRAAAPMPAGPRAAAAPGSLAPATVALAAALPPDAGHVPDKAAERRLARAMKLFGADGRLMHWPTRGAVQQLCLWVMWSRLPPRVALSEREVNALFDGWHGFGDRAVLRRGLIDAGLARRNADGSDYRRIETAPPQEAKALIAAVGR